MLPLKFTVPMVAVAHIDWRRVTISRPYGSRPIKLYGAAEFEWNTIMSLSCGALVLKNRRRQRPLQGVSVQPQEQQERKTERHGGRVVQIGERRLREREGGGKEEEEGLRT